MAKCKACGAEIEFVRTPAGKLMPVETEYLIIVTDDGKVVRGRAPHWAACPAAKNFRKGDKDNVQRRQYNNPGAQI